jgi:hypothetical protein
MPVEIRQLVVKANVRDTEVSPTKTQDAGESANKKTKDTLGFYEREELINEVIERVMAKIKVKTDL